MAGTGLGLITVGLAIGYIVLTGRVQAVILALIYPWNVQLGKSMLDQTPTANPIGGVYTPPVRDTMSGTPNANDLVG